MRCDRIRIHAEIPVPINSNGIGVCKVPCFEDGNGVVYEISAVQDACEDIAPLPIIRYDDSGEPVVIGVADYIKWNPDGYIEVDGIINHGGTSEEIIFSCAKEVTSMEIESVGLGCE